MVMVFPYGLSPAPPGEVTAEETSGEVTTINQAAHESSTRAWTVEISPGQKIDVIFIGIPSRFTLQLDNLGKPLISASGISQLRPTTFEREGGFEIALSGRGSCDSFDSLPLKTRDRIYGYVYHAMHGPPYWPQDATEKRDRRLEAFLFQRRLARLRFLNYLARLNRAAAPRRCSIAFANKQALAETTPYILASEHFLVCGSSHMFALLESMGRSGREKWHGPVTLMLEGWKSSTKPWGHLPYYLGADLKDSIVRRVDVVSGVPDWDYGPDDDLDNTPLGQLAWAFGICSVVLKHVRICFKPPWANDETDGFIHSQFQCALRGEPWEGGFLQRGGKNLLLHKVYEAIN